MAYRTADADSRDALWIEARSFAGQEIDLTATYEVTENVEIHVGTATSLPAIAW